jgi:ABC-type multidrug transport system ATPase subunit
MSVADNIEFRIDLLGGDASGAAAQLELFSLRGYENAPVKSLSTGLRQRASLAAGFSVGPSLALLDEPTNAVDSETRLLLEDLLRGRGLNHGSALVVTHDLDFAYSVADRCIVMQDGKELAQRRPAEYPSSKDFQSEYLSLTSGRGPANASHHY